MSGRDGTKNKILKLFSLKQVFALCNIINTAMKLVYFFLAQKESTVIFLPEPGKFVYTPMAQDK